MSRPQAERGVERSMAKQGITRRGILPRPQAERGVERSVVKQGITRRGILPRPQAERGVECALFYVMVALAGRWRHCK